MSVARWNVLGGFIRLNVTGKNMYSSRCDVDVVQIWSQSLISTFQNLELPSYVNNMPVLHISPETSPLEELGSLDNHGVMRALVSTEGW